MDAWLAEPSVMEALHVKANTPGIIVVSFIISNDSTPLSRLHHHILLD